MNPKRRSILQNILGIASAPLLLNPIDSFGQQGLGPIDGYDLIITGGRVIDPSQKFDQIADIGIRNQKIVEIKPQLTKKSAQTINASGKIITPGLIDLHAHCYPQASAIGLPADELVYLTGTTTFVDAGDAGANNFSAFKHYIAAQARSRMYAFLHISSIGLAGFPVGEMKNLEYANIDLAARTLNENSDILLGIKVRESLDVVGENGIEPLRRAVLAAERSGVKGARVMCHIGNAPGDLSVLLDTLRPGDVLTHAYSGAGNNTVQNGKLIAAALEAKKRGVIIDVGHGGGSFDFTVAEPAIQQGLIPNTISSDLHAYSGNSPSIPYLPNVMSKFLTLGFTVNEVIAMTTSHPGKIINRDPLLGTLKNGASADITIFDLIEKPTEWLDTKGNKRPGQMAFVPFQTIRGGVPYGRPFPSPFSYS
ncbi:amidohydrolase/deacetylase family metallohydrolase [Polynucleobacter sp. JS-JIR-II-c23]|uniref:amidohydrolase/deacetylase family metallohydrolase n=1 Tax=Polynucleobacter sp. JS-JIR-II-c23 TaxID=1758393 RepID=UPI002B23B76B|nr:amidohydrolase/deacetylase family metallohydrolase [Polynucleobacter sp. JS-JIR-II-c23]MEA9603322.1 amidohydrolase/deacetylase family metallohydrolase [Polynucleobacter sp. JS-JIR-II-c23]